MQGNIILRVESLSKNFGGIRALDNVNMVFEKTKITGIIGPNGAGKSTLLKVITGFYAPTKGKVIFENREIQGLPPHKITSLGISLTFQIPRIPKEFTVRELITASVGWNNYVSKKMLSSRENEFFLNEVEKILRVLGLEDYAEREAASLPLGIQKKIELGRALSMKPKIIMLDEPAAGMSHEEAQELANLIIELKKKYEITILLVEHNVPLAVELSNFMYVLHYGRILSFGPPEEVINDKKVIDAYLGAGYAKA